MKTSYLRASGISVGALVIIYLVIYMSGSFRIDKPVREGIKDQDVLMRKLDRIEQNLNKMGLYDHLNTNLNRFVVQIIMATNAYTDLLVRSVTRTKSVQVIILMEK